LNDVFGIKPAEFVLSKHERIHLQNPHENETHL
jgi:hypothetical protein